MAIWRKVCIGLVAAAGITAAAAYGLDAADRFLSDPEIPPALRRLVLEGRAGVERSLRARASGSPCAPR